MQIALVIGYGSIGRRHLNVLKKINFFDELYVLSSQKITRYKKINKLSQIKSLNPDYIIIAKPTTEHYDYLNYCVKNLKNKKILVEKPLFSKNLQFNANSNKVYVGYNLRFHPVIKKLKSEIKNKKIFNVNIQNSSYLPSWRKNNVYTKTSSAKKSLGGGVLLDISHELDFIRYLFGNFIIKHVVSKKISKLLIDTDDILVLYLIAKNSKSEQIDIQVNLNFFSHVLKRTITCDSKNMSFVGDIMNNTFNYFRNKRKRTIKFKTEKNIILNQTYIDMHHAILNNDNEITCDLKQGKKLMHDIERIRKKINK